MSIGLLLKAFLTRRAGLAKAGTIPRLEAHRDTVRVDVEKLTRYSSMCGFTDDGQLPPTFPQMLAGDLHIRLLADARFPLPVAGIVHFENRIVQHAPLPADGTYDLEAFVEGHRDTPRGVLFDVETRMSRGGRLVWEATTTVLSRPRDAAKSRAGREPGQRPAPPAAGLEAPPLRTAVFHLPAELGRRYSALAGDYNPIHLSALTARPFGFKRAIIHGMWTLARCLGEMADELPPTPRVFSVRFERPVFLPGCARFAVTRDGRGGLDFTLTSPDLNTRHFTGAVRPQSTGAGEPD